MSLIKPALRFALFGTSLVIGLWMAHTIHDPFSGLKPAAPQFSLNNAQVEQYRLLLIIVDKITGKPVLQSIWLISNRADMPTAMVSIYPNITQQTLRDDELNQSFKLSGLLSYRKPDQNFLDLLNEWDIHWNDYVIIDLAVQSAIIDQYGGIMIDGANLTGNEFSQQTKKISSSIAQINFQTRLWRSICSWTSQKTDGFILENLPLNLKNHMLSSINSEKPGSFSLFPSRPTFPVCMVNSGLMEAAKPPISVTK